MIDLLKAAADCRNLAVYAKGGYFDVEDVSTHHDVALLTWLLVQPDGTVLAKGHDQIRVSPEGKIVELLTFAPSVSEP